ncbi:hypothetical protein SLEP1_g22338 [Rubroshorea leprosula]|uniref:Aminotransferase-like plant mobile domain-containing protein n=1 Tax=Rubroshorea leprosula TaxID=152421 RepID=A0AAV5JBV8_9ROSI|nr:hypothetical protein SLEP1_g22338 [Rubroshorea leprosula]
MNSQILGPYFISPPPFSLKFLYPQSKEHLLPFQVKPDWSKWVGHFGTWPAWKRSEWVDWVNRLEPAFNQIWRDVGLFEFMQLTTCRFSMDKPILSLALLFWSGSFNCFHFPCGAMSDPILHQFINRVTLHGRRSFNTSNLATRC